MTRVAAKCRWFVPIPVARGVAAWRNVCSLVLLLLSAQVGAAQEVKTPPPREMAVACRDGMSIVCTYFAGTKGKDTVPIILLHDHKGTRRDLEPLALSLQSLLGAAVIAPDLRGHGDSHLPKVAGGKATAVDNFGKPEFEAMVEQDLEAIKKFLVRENNTEKLNIDKLCIVGVGSGGAVGALWGVKDWSWPMLTTGKQGQDVKALVLISPAPNYRGLNIAAGLALPTRGTGPYRSSVAVMIIAGENDAKGKSDSSSVVNQFKQGRSKEELDRNQIETCTLFIEYEPTKLQGTKLLSEASLNVDKKIAAFIKLRVADKPAVWQTRLE